MGARFGRLRRACLGIAAAGVLSVSVVAPSAAQTGSIDPGSLGDPGSVQLDTGSVDGLLGGVGSSGGSGSAGSTGSAGGDVNAEVARFAKPQTAAVLDIVPKPGTVMTEVVPIAVTAFDSAGRQKITVPASFPATTVGAALHIGASEAFPTGAMGRVTSVDTSGPHRVLTVERITYADAFDKYAVDATFEYGDTTQPITDGYVAPPRSGFRPTAMSGGLSTLWKSPFKGGGELTMSCSRGLDLAEGLKAELRHFSTTWRTTGDLTRLETLTVTAGADITYAERVKLVDSLGCSISGNLPGIPLAHGAFNLAPGASGGLELKGRTELVVGLRSNNEVRVSFDPRGAKIGSKVTRFDNGLTSDTGVTVSPDQMTLKLHMLGTISTAGDETKVGAEVGVEVGPDFILAKAPPNCLDFNVGMSGEFFAGVHAEVGWFKIDNSLSAPFELPSAHIGKACGPTTPPPTTGTTPKPKPVVTGTSGGAGTSGSVGRKDTVFVIDTTGSMGGLIGDARARAASLAGKLLGSDPKARVGLVEYRDHGDDFVARTDVPLTHDYAAFQAGLDALVPAGGGDTPEAVYSGIVEALRASWDPAAMRSVIVIGDAPAHDPEAVTGYTRAQIDSLLRGYGAVPSFSPVAEPAARAAAGDRAQAPGVPATAPAARPGFAPIADPVGAPERPSVSLYGITTTDYLAEQLRPLAESTKGTVVDISSATSVGDAIDKALTDIENRPVAVVSAPGSVTAGTAFEVDCSASTAAAGVASRKVAVDGGAPIDCAGAKARVTVAKAGEHTILLTVVDTAGREAVAKVVVVAEAATAAGGSLDLPSGSLAGLLGGLGSSS